MVLLESNINGRNQDVIGNMAVVTEAPDCYVGRATTNDDNALFEFELVTC